MQQSFSYGFARVVDGNDTLIIDKAGSVMEGFFRFTEKFTDSLALVKTNNMFTYINNEGEQITDWFTNASELKHGFALVQKDSIYALMNSSGQIVTRWYDRYSYWGGDLLFAYMTDSQCNEIVTDTFHLYEIMDNYSKYKTAQRRNNPILMYSNYIDRELPYNLNNGFFSEGNQVLVKENAFKWRMIKKISAYLENDMLIPFRKFSLADINGMRLTPWYGQIYDSSNRLVRAQANDKYQTLNSKFQIG